MFKRKSFRQFKSNELLSNEELQKIKNFIDTISERISSDMPLKYKIVPSSEASCKRGEYCILIYSNHDNKSLLNVGYTFAQLDFFLSSINIGSCWYGMGKPNDSSQFENLPYVIMIAMGKASQDEFRKNYRAAKRKANEDISSGDLNQSLLEYVKYSPSACNSQPWILVGNQHELSIKMNTKEKMLIPKDKISFYNTIDLGIMLLSCEMWLRKNSTQYERELYDKNEPFKNEDIIVSYKFD
jgi:nitroreductase